MPKVRLDPREVEAVRVAVLRLMLERELTSGDVARKVPTVRCSTLRAFLAGRRASPRVAIELVARLQIGLAYSAPSIRPTPSIARSTDS